MSAIVGIFHLDGSPIDPAALEAMTTSLAHRGLDGNRRWRSGAVGFGHLMFWITPESLRERLPLTDETGNLVVPSDTRIDNREQLISVLRIDHHPQREVTDSQLILAAYQKWGERCAEYLDGDFAFAIWDQVEHKLMCFRDHLGMRQLFYYQDDNKFVFASEIKGILAAGIPKMPDRRKLALIALPMPGKWDKERTYFQGVYKLPPATILTICAEGCRLKRYWEPNPVARFPYKTDSEYLEAFRELFFRSIAARTRSAFPVAALLSGGLDSSGIVSVAAHHLAGQNQRLITLSAVVASEQEKAFQDEKEYIHLFHDWDNLDMIEITAAQRGPFDDVEQLVWGYGHPNATSRHYLYSAFAQKARENGVRIILDGVGGEFGPSFHGDGYLAELLLLGRWRTLLQETRSKAKREGTDLWKLFLRQVMRPLLPHSALRLLGRHKRADIAHYLEHQPLQPAFVKRQLGTEWAGLIAEAESSGLPLPNHRKNMLRAFQSVWGLNDGGGFANYEWVRINFPYGDRTLLEFCLAAPGRLKMRNGYKRYLLRAGLDGQLPPKIQWRTSKAPFSPDFPWRYNRDKKKILPVLSEISTSDPIREVVDIKKLQKLVQHEMLNERGQSSEDFAAMHIIPKGIYLIAFLRQFVTYQP